MVDRCCTTYSDFICEAIIAERTDASDLKRKYDHYNKLLFDGSLPQIPITRSTLKQYGGVVKYGYEVDPAKKQPTPFDIKYRGVSKYAGKRVIAGSMRMIISDLYERDDQGVDGILLHEMIHVHFAAMGRLDVNHGEEFVNMCHKLSKIVGFDIPLTDDITGLKITKNTRTIGFVLVTTKDGKKRYAIMSPNVLNSVLQPMAERWQHFVDVGINGVVNAQLGYITADKWSEMSYKLPMQRLNAKNLRNMGFFALSDPEMIAELPSAQIIWTTKDRVPQ